MSSVSVVTWNPNSPHLRVYRSEAGKIRERCQDGPGLKWYDSDFSVPGNSVGATCWVDSSQQHHIRLYIADESGSIVEQYWDGGEWYEGDFPGEKGVSANAVSWVGRSSGNAQIRVYVTKSDSTIVEWNFDGSKWKRGTY